jgi:succinate dehydrogenase / fumarate reductase cytochrome b subunit
VAEQQSFLDKHHFLLRRLHSLTGIVPIGVFLIAHLVTNSSLAWGAFALRGEPTKEPGVLPGGAQYFQEEVLWINSEIPHLFLIEITLWLAIGFHSVLGVYYATTGKRNTKNYAYQDNWRYTLQRISGYLGILFIFYHIATLRWQWDFLVPGGATWSHHFSASTLAAAMKGSTDTMTAGGFAVSLLYLVGVTMLVFHFANGLWTAAITWGLTISEQAQKRWGVVCAGLGAALMVAGWSAFAGALALDHDTAKRVEIRLIMDNPEHLEIVKEKYGEAYWDELVTTYMSDEDPHGADEPETTANADG